jgi:tRNA (cmo5U34)-methyltransferase
MSVGRYAAERLFEGPIAEEYGMLKRICPAAADISRRVGEWVAAWTPPAGTGTPHILEIGSGTGVTTLHLLHARPEAQLTGIDNGPTMLEQARRNLAEFEGRLRLVEADALTYLRSLPDASLDLVASAYTLHNFLDGYRGAVLEEIQRALKPGGAFVNGDRYALDDSLEHLRLTQAEVRGYFRVFVEMGRPDVLEEWVVHLFSDESPDRIMRLDAALERLGQAGFSPVVQHFRDGVNTLVSAAKPSL